MDNTNGEKKETKHKTIVEHGVNQFRERCQKFYDLIKSGKGMIYIKITSNKDPNSFLKLNNKSFSKIIDFSSILNHLLSYIINTTINETPIEIASSTEIFNDSNENFIHIFENKKEFTVTMGADMELPTEEKVGRQIMIKNKSVRNILTKIGGPLNDNLHYIQLLLMQVSYDSTKILTEYIINRYKFLMDSRKIFYISYNHKKDDDDGKEENEEDDDKNFPVSFYSIKKILGMFEKDENQKDKYLELILLGETPDKTDEAKNTYLKKLTNYGEHCEIFKKYKENEEKYSKNILDKKVEIQRMEKVRNNEMNNCFDVCDELLNEKKRKDNEKIQLKKKEVEDAINNRYNRFIEILHNDKDKKFINLQYLDLLEGFNKKNSKYKMDYYVAKNDRFKEIKIPSECINAYMIYKTEYEKRQYVLLNFKDNNKNSKNEEKYLVNINDLKQLYNKWTVLEKEEEINTVNPQFEGKRINLYKACVVNVVDIKLPEQPDLQKKIEEEKEQQQKEKEKEKEKEIKNNGLYHDRLRALHGNLKEKKTVTIRRRIIKKKKNKEHNN